MGTKERQLQQDWAIGNFHIDLITHEDNFCFSVCKSKQSAKLKD